MWRHKWSEAHSHNGDQTMIRNWLRYDSQVIVTVWLYYEVRLIYEWTYVWVMCHKATRKQRPLQLVTKRGISTSQWFTFTSRDVNKDNKICIWVTAFSHFDHIRVIRLLGDDFQEAIALRLHCEVHVIEFLLYRVSMWDTSTTDLWRWRHVKIIKVTF